MAKAALRCYWHWLRPLFLVAILNRFWPIPSRKVVNDVTGWQLGILGTTYGVILGFMLYTVWTDFRTADVDVNLEASSLLNVNRIAAGLPAPQREDMQRLTAKYADAAVAPGVAGDAARGAGRCQRGDRG